ncbi:redoxin domain-containing protein [Confluentibacter sediminis]|uniref:redoxin domain-containing protein n=1 Tax=Confluentibacter sediminis TaxID=2219045 RepID=UPI000DAE08E2|nr:redoxin domain-containing protein [Confluentibacter sediminis]
MRKTNIIFFILSLLIINSCKRELTTEQIVEKVQETIENSKFGYYKQTEITKQVSVGEDSTTTESQRDFYYKKEPKDTLIGFKIASFEKNGFHQVYNTENLFGLTTWNKTLTITDKNQYPKQVSRIKQFYNSFPFFFFVKNIFDNATKNDEIEIINLGSTKINNQDCYKLTIKTPKNDDQMSSEQIYYISKDTYLPIGSDISVSTKIVNATEIISFKIRISDINLKGEISDEIFTQEKLSEYVKVINYTPELEQRPNTLLAIGEKAPEWELSNSKGTKINLNDLNGKIAIMDFWYKACGPCNKQMIKLQELHDKYPEDKVKFIGINTIDDPIEDNIDLFLGNRNISMETVFNGKTIENDYQVTASPALFVIDQNGIIVHNIDGYSSNIVEELTEVIEKYLK